MRLTCEWCGQGFEAKAHRRACNRTHSAYLATRSRAQEPWREEEIDLIHRLAGTYSALDIAKRLQRLQRSSGWAVRTANAVKTKVKQLGYPTKPYLDNFPRDQLSKILDISRDRSQSWHERFGMPTHRVGPFVTIKVSEFKQWAYSHPDCLAGIEAERLDWLMNDREFCDRVECCARPRMGVRQPIVRVSDGARFPSINAAAKECFLHPSSIKRALRKPGAKCLGSEWKYLHSRQAIAPARYRKSA